MTALSVTLPWYTKPTYGTLHPIGDNSLWIHQVILLGPLCIVHDGLCMEYVTTYVYSSGVYIYCQQNRSIAKHVVDKCSNKASNYRGEILGAIITQLIF